MNQLILALAIGYVVKNAFRFFDFKCSDAWEYPLLLPLVFGSVACISFFGVVLCIVFY